MSEQMKNNIQSNWPPSGGTGVCRINQGNAKYSTHKTASSDNIDSIRTAIKNKYAEVSLSAAGKFQYPIGEDGANSLKYDQECIKDSPQSLLESFCGVGNPCSLGKIKSGDVVLDVGCGAGFDMFIASRLVGESGKICGIDLTDQMAEKAQKNLTEAGITNFEIKKVDSEDIPYAISTFDLVISNGVINLSPRKNILFKEIYRVLKPGGRLQFADVVLSKEMPSHLSKSMEAWSQWIGGTIPVGDQIKRLEEADFINVEYLGETGFHTSQYTVGGLFRAKKIELSQNGIPYRFEKLEFRT